MHKSFSLIELMLVLVIIGVLASLVAPRLRGRAQRARTIAAKADIEANMSAALDLYEMDLGFYPKELGDLVNTPVGQDAWAGPYLKKTPKDPWQRDYHYQTPGIHNQDYDLASAGKDGVLGNDDDVFNWE
ncbi:MAG: type II secretion system major pseudopilin GspG [Candidatus Omnitrophica bacterium]|nr:type II secretion system major pseudopilin GspG [Candidatus Omnitrophota bacterium]